MRLPGTLNVPDKKKLALARLVEWHDDRVYPLSAFPAATRKTTPQQPSSSTSSAGFGCAVGAGEELLKLLPKTVSESVKETIRHGFPPEQPIKFPSRSEAVMSVACALHSARCDRDLLISILLDPSFGISAHVLEQPKPGPYAARQADRAAAFVEGRPFRALTDMGNAYLLVDLHGPDILHCYPHKSWYVWDGCRWVRDDGHRIEKMVKDVPVHLREEAGRVGDEKLADRIKAWAQRSEGSERLRAIARVAQSEVPVEASALDADSMLLNVANGTLDLRTGSLRAFNRDDLITKQGKVDFDPEAKCPMFMAFIARIMGYPTAAEEITLDATELRRRKRAAIRLISFLQRALGYSLTGRTDEQVFFIAHGTGQNGKSTLLEIVRAAFGDYARSTDTQTFAANDRRDASGPTENIARLQGARLVTAVENSEDQRLDEKLIKQITGGDKITARHLYQASFEFVPTFKVWIAANSLPDIRGQDPAIWRRPKAIPFEVTIPKEERDTTLKDRIIADELSGVLAWMVRGCLKWQRRGLKPPAEVEAYTDQYRGDMDIIGDFVKTVCKVEQGTCCPAKDLWDRYEQWCHDNGEQPLKQRTFGRRLRERGIRSEPVWSSIEKKVVRYYSGISIADESGPPPAACSAPEIPF
jgi:putative DNA primase/helicase